MSMADQPNQYLHPYAQEDNSPVEIHDPHFRATTSNQAVRNHDEQYSALLFKSYDDTECINNLIWAIMHTKTTKEGPKILGPFKNLLFYGESLFSTARETLVLSPLKPVKFH